MDKLEEKCKYLIENRSIKTEVDYNLALNCIECLFNAKPNTPEEKILDLLVTLVEDYENKIYGL